MQDSDDIIWILFYPCGLSSICIWSSAHWCFCKWNIWRMVLRVDTSFWTGTWPVRSLLPPCDKICCNIYENGILQTVRDLLEIIASVTIISRKKHPKMCFNLTEGPKGSSRRNLTTHQRLLLLKRHKSLAWNDMVKSHAGAYLTSLYLPRVFIRRYVCSWGCPLGPHPKRWKKFCWKTVLSWGPWKLPEGEESNHVKSQTQFPGKAFFIWFTHVKIRIDDSLTQT